MARLRLPHFTFKFPRDTPSSVVLRSLAATVWWAQYRLSSKRVTVGVVILKSIGEGEISFITNDAEVAELALSITGRSLSLREWYEKTLIKGGWDLRTPPTSTLEEISRSCECVSCFMELSKTAKKAVFTTVKNVNPEKVNTLSGLLLFLGALSRGAYTFRLKPERLHPVILRLLEKIAETGMVNFEWLGYDRENPEALIWTGEETTYII